MNLLKYLNKRIKLVTTNNEVFEGKVIAFIGKADTEEGLYDAIDIDFGEFNHLSIEEVFIKSIEIIN